MTYRRWASLHRTIGLALLAHWALLALSGMLLVFHRDIEQQMLASAPGSDRRASLTAVTQSVAAARPQAEILQISTLNGGTDLLRIRVKPTSGGEVRSLVFDTHAGTIIGDSQLSGSMRADGILQFVYRLHQTLLLGDGGKTLVAFSGLFLVFTSFAGYRLLWPQRRNWRRIIRPKLVGNARSRMTLVHRAIGVLVGPVLIILAITGAGMNWTPAIKSALVGAGLAEAAAAAADSEQAPRLGPDGALDAARRRFPDAEFTSVTLPAKGSAIYAVRLRQPREAHAIFGMTNVLVDGVTGEILSVTDPRQSKAGDKVLEWLFAIHNGEFLGLAGRLVVLLTGGALFLLCLLGGASWWRRPRPRRDPGGARTLPGD